MTKPNWEVVMSPEFLADPTGPDVPRRRRGVPPEVPAENLRKMVLEALNHAGGVAYLVQQAYLNPKAFMTLLARAMPPAPPAPQEATPLLTPVEMTDEQLALIASRVVDVAQR